MEAAVRRDAHYWAGAHLIEDGNPPVPAAPVAESVLAALLLEWTAWGLISFPMLQKVAAAAQDDGLNNPDIDRLASLGGEHSHPIKMWCGVLAQLRKRGLPQPVHIQNSCRAIPWRAGGILG